MEFSVIIDGNPSSLTHYPTFLYRLVVGEGQSVIVPKKAVFFAIPLGIALDRLLAANKYLHMEIAACNPIN